jgi:hypothetical protein
MQCGQIGAADGSSLLSGEGQVVLEGSVGEHRRPDHTSTGARR